MNYYQFKISDQKVAGYKRVASLLFIINSIAFFALGYAYAPIDKKIILIAAAILSFFYGLYHWKFNIKKNRSYIAAYFLVAVVWLIETPYYYFSIVFLFLLILQYRMEGEAVVIISESEIKVNSFLNSTYNWNEFNNIVLKDGLLTLDFINNKILQVKPDWNGSHQSGIDKSDPEAGKIISLDDYPVLEKEFNDFCQNQLQFALSKKSERSG